MYILLYILTFIYAIYRLFGDYVALSLDLKMSPVTMLSIEMSSIFKHSENFRIFIYLIYKFTWFYTHLSLYVKAQPRLHPE